MIAAAALGALAPSEAKGSWGTVIGVATLGAFIVYLIAANRLGVYLALLKAAPAASSSTPAMSSPALGIASGVITGVLK